MARTVGDYVLERLRAWGVEKIFGYPGDGINGLLAAWARADNQPQFIQARHEMSALEAVGYAKFTARVGVCAATSGPGAVHLLNGLYDAKLDRALRTALGRRAPTAIIIPGDVQELDYSAPGHEFKMVPSSIGVSWPTTAPEDEAVVRAAEVLNAGSKVAILAGQGARAARHELLEVAEVPELPDDAGLRHAAHRRLEFPLQSVPARTRPGSRSADRPGPQLDRAALPNEVNFVGDAAGFSRRSAHRPGRALRPRCPANPAPRDVRADEGRCPCARQGEPGQVERGQRGLEDQGARAYPATGYDVTISLDDV